MRGRPNWKRTERKIATHLGGRRVPVTGRSRGDAPDIAHDWLSVEVKHRATLPGWLHDALRQAVASAQSADKLSVVVLHESGQRHTNDMVVLRLADFVDWFGALLTASEDE